MTTTTPQPSDAPPLDHVLQIFFQSLESMACSTDVIAAGINLVINLTREHDS
jgi:hypothetical protein